MNATLAHRETIHESKFTKFHKDIIEFEDGHLSRREVVERPDAVVILAHRLVAGDTDQFFFVQQFRWSVGQSLIELPAGKIEDGQTMYEAAERELREEIKMTGKLTHLGSFYASPGYSTEMIHAFEATCLSSSPLPADEDEDIQVVPLVGGEVRAAIAQGQIIDGKTLATLFLYKGVL